MDVAVLGQHVDILFTLVDHGLLTAVDPLVVSAMQKSALGVVMDSRTKRRGGVRLDCQVQGALGWQADVDAIGFDIPMFFMRQDCFGRRQPQKPVVMAYTHGFVVPGRAPRCRRRRGVWSRVHQQRPR